MIRLSNNIRPTHYAITMTPNLEDFTFTGKSSINLTIDKATSRISFNAVDLSVTSADLKTDTSESLGPCDVETDNDSEIVTIVFESPIKVGSYLLALEFKGALNDQLRGFYKSQYEDTTGKTQYIAATQFESTDARRAFPCWDEPAMKATFDLTLVIPRELTGISNTLVKSENLITPDKKEITFETTPVMSTYLLMFIVGDLACVETKVPSGPIVRVWATKGKESQGEFALENSVRLLEYMNNYFKIPYPLSKLDHIALPDFAAGAMENWGAITYREVALLHDTDNTSSSSRQRIVEIIAHEMAHMWFGDLVTMEWWDDLWLNESFASWMGDSATHNLYPEWEMWTQFVSDDTNAGLSLDGLKSTHPIEAKVENPAEISELFDAISYSKGAATIRMLEQYIGPDNFRQGLHNYLSKHSYGNARTEDLWAALESSSHMAVSSVMNTWIKQAGFPLVTIETSRKSKHFEITASQKRFLYENILGSEETRGSWKIPLNITAVGDQPTISHLLQQKREQVTLPIDTDSKGIGAVKVNFGQSGFFRVNYGNKDWLRLKSSVENLTLPAIDRLGLQNDCFALARAGYLKGVDFLTFAKASKSENNSIVWRDLTGNIQAFGRLICQEDYWNEFQDYILNLYSNIVKSVGWEKGSQEGHLESILRNTVIRQAGLSGSPEVRDEAITRFNSYLEDPMSLDPDLRGPVFDIVGHYGDSKTFDVMWNLVRQAKLQEEKLRLLSGLSHFSKESLLSQTLERSLQGDVRSQDTVSIITNVAMNPAGTDLTWSFIKDNWTELDRRYGKGGFVIMRLVSITGMFSSPIQAEEVRTFFNNHPAPAARRTIEQCIERIGINGKWLNTNRDSLAKMLKR